MADIFIGYASEDRPHAERLAGALESQGWSVWWDVRIPAGRTFDEVIEEAIASAKCVIVLWTNVSVKKRWVLTEAEEGATRKILVPILIEKDVPIPLAFKRIQAADLVGWDGSETAASFRRLVGDVAAIVGSPPSPEVEAKRRRDKDVMSTERIIKRPPVILLPQQEAPPPGPTFRDGSDTPEMVVIPAGRFTMGSSASEKGREKDEGGRSTRWTFRTISPSGNTRSRGRSMPRSLEKPEGNGQN